MQENKNESVTPLDCSDLILAGVMFTIVFGALTGYLAVEAVSGGTGHMSYLIGMCICGFLAGLGSLWLALGLTLKLIKIKK